MKLYKVTKLLILNAVHGDVAETRVTFVVYMSCQTVRCALFFSAVSVRYSRVLGTILCLLAKRSVQFNKAS